MMSDDDWYKPHRPPAAFWWVIALALLSGLLYASVQSAHDNLYAGRHLDTSGLLGHSISYALAILGLFGLYAVLLGLSAQGRLSSRGTRVVALVSPLFFNLFFLLESPKGIDVLSYLAHGHIAGSMGGNPYLQPGDAVAGSRYGADLAVYGWAPGYSVSPYGPLWTAVESGITSAVDHVPGQLLAVKGLAVAASAASAVLIWLILAQLRPADRLLGTLAFVWNPTVVIEFAGEGHNDALMNLFVLLAIALALRSRPVATMIALSAGILTKYLPLLFLPVLVGWFWRTRRNSIATASRLAAGLAVAILMAFVAFQPWWSGLATFDGIRLMGRLGQTGSTPTIILEFLTHITDVPPLFSAVILSSTAVLAIVLAAAASSPVNNAQALLRSCAVIAIASLLLLSPNYWPWYVTLPVTLLVLLPGYPPLLLAGTVSLGSRLVAPLDVLFERRAISHFWFLFGTWVIGIAAPLAVGVMTSAPGRARHRLRSAYGLVKR